MIRFVVDGVRWFDRVNGNTYHSVKVTRVIDGKQIVSDKMVYGYDDHYRQTALELMFQEGFIPKKYFGKEFMYNRENGYPIEFRVKDGLKREMYANVNI